MKLRMINMLHKKVFCDITSTSGSKTLFSEVSQPFETGIIIGEPESSLNLFKTGLNLIKNGDVTTVEIKQQLPMSCPHDQSPEGCSLRIFVKQMPDGEQLHTKVVF